VRRGTIVGADQTEGEEACATLRDLG
jgi:hypothetical protein